MLHLKLEVPEEPDIDYEIRAAITTFYYASRSRSYLSGMTVIPLPIGVKDITNVVDAHPVYVDREVLDACVFAIDDEFMSESQKISDKAQ